MLLDGFQPEQQSRVIKVYSNGATNQQKYVEVILHPEIQISMVKHQLEVQFGQFPQLRLFNVDGVEVFEEDLQFIKSNSVLYASFYGDDFDQRTGFNQYVIIKKLGQGGFGSVLLGQHKYTKEKVAIKIVNTASIGNAEDIDMVFREAEMLKSLVHKNIVKIYNCFTLSNMQVVFVMEYLDGGELLQYVQNQSRISEDEARIFFLQIANAIQYCHHQKLIHRDLKLENILIAEKGKNIVKIVDFGIAGLVSNYDVSKIGAGSLKYMAPEIFLRNVNKIGTHIDIWALGVILYCMVTGTQPFNGETTNDIINSILEVDYSFPRDISISCELRDLISQILNPNFNERIIMMDILKHPWCLGRQTEFIQVTTIRPTKRTVGINEGKNNKSKLSQNTATTESLQEGNSFIKNTFSKFSSALKAQKSALKQTYSSSAYKKIDNNLKHEDDDAIPIEFKEILANIKQEDKDQSQDEVIQIEKSEKEQESEQKSHFLPELIPQLVLQTFTKLNSQVNSPKNKKILKKNKQTKSQPFITKDYTKILKKFQESQNFKLRRDLRENFSLLEQNQNKRLQFEQQFLKSLSGVKSDRNNYGKSSLISPPSKISIKLPLIDNPGKQNLIKMLISKHKTTQSPTQMDNNNVKIGFYQQVKLRINLKKQVRTKQ